MGRWGCGDVENYVSGLLRLSIMTLCLHFALCCPYLHFALCFWCGFCCAVAGTGEVSAAELGDSRRAAAVSDRPREPNERWGTASGDL